MTDAACLQAAAWLSALGLVPYAAMLFLLLAATLRGWYLLQSTALPRLEAHRARQRARLGAPQHAGVRTIAITPAAPPQHGGPAA